MKVFLDCEWNGHRGQLISMALIDESSNEFYEVLSCPNPTDWVEKNVIPVLNKEPIDRHTFNIKLKNYLQEYDALHVVADWPEDIAHFCNALIIRPLSRIGLDRISFTVDQNLFRAQSKTPHNALSDAKAMKKYYESNRPIS